jgi:hypothetical protein
LLALDPDLGQLVDRERIEQADRDLLVRVHALAPGDGPLDRPGDVDAEYIGLLVVDGVLAREVAVADHVSSELLGPGDIVRPWPRPDDDALLRLEVRWSVLAPSRVAVLDRPFTHQLVRYPEVNAVMMARLDERAGRLATVHAISQLTRVQSRLLALFWHLSERWGRVSGEGVVVPLVLPHRLLAQLIGARRPTVSTALGELARTGGLVRRDDGTWLLTGEPVGLPAGEARRPVRTRRAVLAPPERVSAAAG